MIEINNLTLSEIVKSNVKTADVFEKYSLDFCCKGNKSIVDACSEKNVDINEVIKDLENISFAAPAVHNYEEWDLDFLVDYIINTHHSYVRRMIPVIAEKTAKILSKHPDIHPEIFEIHRIFGIVYKELKQHMVKEEEILFPHIKYMNRIKKNGGTYESPYFGNVKNPIKMMEAEHQAAGDELFEIRRITNGYTPSEDSCNTYRTLYNQLKEFEEDLHKHVHLENYILFPKAVALEEELNLLRNRVQAV